MSNTAKRAQRLMQRLNKKKENSQGARKVTRMLKRTLSQMVRPL